jgi:hypothetical protein
MPHTFIVPRNSTIQPAILVAAELSSGTVSATKSSFAQSRTPTATGRA